MVTALKQALKRDENKETRCDIVLGFIWGREEGKKASRKEN